MTPDAKNDTGCKDRERIYQFSLSASPLLHRCLGYVGPSGSQDSPKILPTCDHCRGTSTGSEKLLPIRVLDKINPWDEMAVSIVIWCTSGTGRFQMSRIYFLVCVFLTLECTLCPAHTNGLGAGIHSGLSYSTHWSGLLVQGLAFSQLRSWFFHP